MPEKIIALLKENSALVGDNLQKFFRILSKPAEFISSIERAPIEQLIPASIFAAMMSLLNLALHIPIFRILHVETESASYFVVDTILTYAFWFIYGSCFHLAAKLFRGRGNYAVSLVSFLYLTAFMPVLTLTSIPLNVILRRHIVTATNMLPVDFINLAINDVFNSSPAIISVIVSIFVFAWYFIALTQVFRFTHKVGRIRGFGMVFLGVLIWQLLRWALETPIFQLFWRSYMV